MRGSSQEDLRPKSKRRYLTGSGGGHPQYPTGFGSSFAFAAAGILASLVLELRFWYLNKQNKKMSREGIREKYTAEELEWMGNRSPLFKYIL